MSSFFIKTLGCKLNQLESEAITDAFLQEGFELYNEQLEINKEQKIKINEFPSVIVINTCTVTSKADQKARREIRKVLRDYPDSCVIVTGCYAQLDKEDLQKLEPAAGYDHSKNGSFEGSRPVTECRQRLFIINKNDILDFSSYFNELIFNKENLIFKIPDFSLLPSHSSNLSSHSSRVFQFNPGRFSNHTRSFLKIQDGCDNNCTYCRIRLARGKSISLDAVEVLSRLRILEKTHEEAVLTGVNICQYNSEQSNLRFGAVEPSVRSSEQSNLRFGAVNNEQVKVNSEQKRFDLAGLLEFLLINTSKINLRLSSLEPEFIDDGFVKILSHKRIRPHFHLSIQSGSKKILEKMGRSYNAQIVERTVSLLRQVKDDPFIACDIISGFPGETEIDFNETFKMCSKLDFAWIHVFPYSKRPGTAAFSFHDTVAETDVKRRVQQLTDLAKQGREAYVRRWIDCEVDILIEKREKETGKRRKGEENNDQFYHGVSENYLKVLVRCKVEIPVPGTVLRCKLTRIGNMNDFDVIGELL